VVAAPLLVWVRLIAPVRGAVRFVADHVATLIVGEEKAPENLLHIDEVKTLVSEAEEEGGITPVCAARDTRLFAAVPLQNENHSTLNGSFRAAAPAHGAMPAQA